MKKLFWLVPLGLLALILVTAGCSSKSSTVKVATDATWPPFEVVDENTKEIVGLDIDLFKAIAEKEGLKLEFVNVSWDPLLAGMAQGTYDAAISSITITEERKKDMLFSDPYFAAGQIVTVRADSTITGKDGLAGKKVGAQLGTTGAFEVEKIPNASLKTYDDIGLAFQDLINGQTDAVIADNPLALDYVAKNSGKLKAVGAVFTDESYGIAVAKGKTDLLKKINSGLAKVKAEGTIEKLSSQWMGK